MSPPVSQRPTRQENNADALPAADDRQAERAAIKAAMRYAVGDTLFPVALGLGLLYLIFGFAHRFTLPAAVQPYMVVTAFSSTLSLLSLAFIVRRWPVHSQYAHPLSALIASFVLLNSILHLLLTADPLQSSNFMLLLVGVGFFLLSSRWFGGALLVVFLCWGLAMMQINSDGATITHFSFGLLSAAVLATLLHYARRRMLTRLTLLRRQDELRAVRLQLALTAERESEVALRRSEANYRQLNQELELRASDLHLVNQQLAKASQLKDEFLASISHELRTPLTAILGLTESLQEQIYGPVNERQRTALHNVEESGRHLLALINDVLDVAKTEAGKLTLQLTPADIAMICDVSLRLVRSEARQKGINLSSQLAEGLTLMLVDERRLKQMLVNLLSNAIKFTPEGGSVGLEVSADQAAETIIFTVWDTGIGIAEADLDRLFKPFVQLDSRLSRRYEGTGLGLVLVYRMAEIHGGSISVTSELQRGSRFTITLPWRQVARGSNGKLAVEPLPATPATDDIAAATPAQMPTILVVEDHELSYEWIATQAAGVGIGTQQVKNRTDALTWLETTKPRLILVDVQSTHHDGPAFWQSLYTHAQAQGIPLVAMSGLVLPNAAQPYLKGGATYYCAKPLTRTILTTLLGQTLTDDPPKLAEMQAL